MKKELLEETTKKRWKKLAGLNEGTMSGRAFINKEKEFARDIEAGVNQPSSVKKPVAQEEAAIVPILTDAIMAMNHPKITGEEDARKVAIRISNLPALKYYRYATTLSADEIATASGNKLENLVNSSIYLLGL